MILQQLLDGEKQKLREISDQIEALKVQRDLLLAEKTKIEKNITDLRSFIQARTP